eukprot:353162-Chlamydomonas_euryale.AAC.3
MQVASHCWFEYDQHGDDGMVRLAKCLAKNTTVPCADRPTKVISKVATAAERRDRANEQGLSQASGHGLGLRLLHDSVTNPRLVIAAWRAQAWMPSGRAGALIASSFCCLLLAGLELICAALWHCGPT